MSHFSHSLPTEQEHRQAALLALVGGLCVAVAIGDGGSVYGENPLSLASFLVPVGCLYLAFALLTYRSPPTTVREAVIGALSASALVFGIGTMGTYYELAVVAGIPVTAALLTDAVAYATIGTLLTLPVSAGWVAGTLLSRNEPLGAVVGVGGVTVVCGAGAATLLIEVRSFSGAAAGFTQVLCFIAVSGAAALGYYPLKTTAQHSPLRDD